VVVEGDDVRLSPLTADFIALRDAGSVESVEAIVSSLVEEVGKNERRCNFRSWRLVVAGSEY
jgi:hypothetical protein